ncbi:amidohydrolase [Pseudodesulfovibrio sediminis]|uniref:Amidohydrolase 3 domain-containing protein n=1 Tax=Pseudodesulfovibrio sediminis TaxID=2810563 RepID=A0ABN6EX47_9BACT|nr:amidohydrolase [Pseudodesulfovibrio sediminis]BCS89759.1 hypothetical protein PSDVSF_30010 [Pseudodesulfovibrio sediminis]
MNDRYLLLNGTILTMDDKDSRHTAVAVENGRIRSVGSTSDMAAFMDEKWPVIDLEGHTVLPGFIDSHQHLGLTGQVLNGIDFLNTRTLDTVYEKVGAVAAQAKPGAWILGYTLNDFGLKEKRLPLKEELDAVCTDNPIMVVHSSWHMCALNSTALDILNLPPDLPGMDLGDDGKPTGVVRDPGAVTHVFPAVSSLTPEDVKMASFRKACEAAIRQGITTLHCLEGGEFGPGDTQMVIRNTDQLPVHTVLWNQVMDIEETVDLDLTRIGGCICADGAIDAYTAALFEPYLDQPGNCGTLNFSQEVMDDFILRAHKQGLQVAIHCETDAAIEQVLSAMEKALAAHPRDDHRHRIEHCEIPTRDQVERMGRAGILAGMQPAFFPYLVDMDDYELRFGKERLRWIHPYRTMREEGVVMCGGSDCPVTPHGPLTGIQAAVLHPIEEERLTPTEAIRMFTIDAAYSAFEEKERGSIEPGKYADLVILAHDPTTVAPEAIRDIKIIKTIVEGKPVEDVRDGPDSNAN